MAKIKVHELAKELSLESRDVVLRLKKMGFIAKNHMGQVDDKYAEQLRAEVGKGSSNAAFVPKVTRIKRSAVEPDTLDASSLDSPEAASTPIADESSKESVQYEEATTMNPQTEDEPIVPDTNLASEELETPEVALSGKTSVLKPLEVKPKTEFQPNTPRPEYNRSRVTAQPNQGNVNTASKPAPSRQQSSYQRPSELSRRNTPSGYSPQGQRTSGQQDSRNSNQPAGGAYQGQRRPNQPSRPYNRGPENTDKDSDTQNTRTGKSQRPPQGKPAAPSVEKPSSTYRQEKKVFVKDVVFESSSMEEKERFFNRNPRGRGRRKKEVRREMPPVTPKKISIPEYIVIGDLAKTMGKSAGELIKKLFEMGTIATINQEIDADTAILLASEFGVTVEVQADKVAEFMEDFEDEDVFLVERPPIVTVMGHVDHGKTSLLDAIKKTNVIATEAGGITQHIGAYQVEINSKKITFLDTPGHEAFTAMRARGTQITDIAVLVVAADDGVMPQTIEAINHARAASVPIIVAINKMDKESANPERVKQELTTYGLVPEEWGGEDIMVSLSAKTGHGIETLLEMILLVAEVKELKANSKRQARGTVVEAELDKTRGPIATLLVQKGTLKIGDSILAGGVFGKVKALNDDKGKKVRSAGPSTPVEVLGFSGVPAAGEIFIAVKDDKDGRLVAYRQQSKKREEELHKTSKVSLDDLFQKIAEGEIKELNLILKADVQGSVEAVSQAIQKLNTSEVKVKIIHAGVGAISESDIMLASASNAIIIGFNIRPDAKSIKAAEVEKVDIKLYRVIYDVTDDIKKAMGGLLKPTIKEVLQGHAEVRNVIKVPKVGMIAGSYVVDGKIVRGSSVRILRDSVVVFEGKIESLKRFKDDAKEVLSGFECGIGVEGFNDIKEGDILESFILEEIRREL